MSEMLAVVTIGIGINTLLNVVWLFIIKDVTKRISRIEDQFINKR